MPFATLRQRVSDVLEKNQIRSGRHRYTRPAPGVYPHQWLWDSCFHAMTYMALGRPEDASEELRSLFRAQRRDGIERGLLPHMTFFGKDASDADQDTEAKAAYARDVALWQDERASTITQPPIVAEAVLATGDRSLFRELWRPLCEYYDYWLRRRDPDGDGLYSIWHLWECGADATPRGDQACRRLLELNRAPRHLDKQTVNPSAKKSTELVAARFLMLESLQEIDRGEREGHLSESDAQKRREAVLGLESIDIQAYLVKNLGAMASIGEVLGESDLPTRYRAAARTIVKAANDKLWNDEHGFYLDRMGPSEDVILVRTHAAFIALYADDLVPKERAERLLRHLCDPNQFWTRWPLPTVARNHATFDPDEYWRGSTWFNVNWLVTRGLVSAAKRFDDSRYLPPARTLAERSLDLASVADLREYYRSGAKHADADSSASPAGFGPESFSWSGIVVDFARMLQHELQGVEALS